jgi:hypothetical protein
LLDPQGGSHFDHFYHDNFHTLTFQGDPTAWKEYGFSLSSSSFFADMCLSENHDAIFQV